MVGAKFYFPSLQDKKGWSSQMLPLFKIVNFVTKYKLVRTHWANPRILTHINSHLIGPILQFMPGMKKGIYKTMTALYPDASKKRINRLVRAGLKYYANLFLNFIFRQPLLGEEPIHKLYKYTNIHYMDSALEEAKKRGSGVIALLLHTGDFFFPITGFTCHPHGYNTTSIANFNNNILYEYIVNKPYFNNLHTYPSVSFRHIGKSIMKRLEQNMILLLYADYSTKKQLRVPMIHGKFPYLIHTAQSLPKLQNMTNSVIVPVITKPLNGLMGSAELDIKDWKPLMKIIDQLKGKHEREEISDKEFHGHVSMEINKIVYSWIRVYAHCWEEMSDLGKKSITDFANFEKDISQKVFVEEIFKKMYEIIKMSWEPDRDEEKLNKLIEEYSKKAISSLKNPDKIFSKNKTFVNLSKISSIDELKKLCLVCTKNLRIREELECVKIFEEFYKEL